MVEQRLSAAEAKNPEAVYTAAIEAGEQRARDLKRQIAALMAQQLRADEPDPELQERIDEAKVGLALFKDELQSLRQEATRAVAQAKLAEARITTQEAAAGFSGDATTVGLSKVRGHIDELYQRANEGMLDSEGNAIHARVEEVRQKTALERAREELERLKAARDGGPTEEE